MKNRLLLAVAATGEAVTGLALLVYPAIIVKLLFGADVVGVAVITSQFAGIALIALAVACWPVISAWRAMCGMLTYSSLASLGLLHLAFSGTWNGPLLWPAAALHVALTLLLARALLKPTSGSM
jgi:hypothetical protein